MMCHYPALDSASDWLKQISLEVRPIRSNTKIWVVSPHQYEISVSDPMTLFPWVSCFLIETKEKHA